MHTLDATMAFVQADIDRPVFLKGLKGWYELEEGNFAEMQLWITPKQSPMLVDYHGVHARFGHGTITN